MQHLADQPNESLLSNLLIRNIESTDQSRHEFIILYHPESRSNTPGAHPHCALEATCSSLWAEFARALENQDSWKYNLERIIILF